MKKQRKHYTRRIEKVAIRGICWKRSQSRSLRASGTPAKGLLPLAKGILSERGCCFRAERTAESFRRKRIAYLAEAREEYQTKDEVLAEPMAEQVCAKESFRFGDNGRHT
jgi:hypothetical protein